MIHKDVMGTARAKALKQGEESKGACVVAIE